MNEYQEYYQKMLDSIDDVFIEMFGKTSALSIYHRMGKSFEHEVAQGPDRYIHDADARKNKKNLITNLICLEFDLNSVWYE